MAVRLSGSGTLIMLPVKVGGTWLRRALTAGAVGWTEDGGEDLRGHDGLEARQRDGSFLATFVREPVDWYRSYWAYRMEGGWRPRYSLDQICGASEFRTFVRNAVVELPGFLSALFERYAGPVDDPVDFVGRQARLADDLVLLLRMRGERFDEVALRATPPANTTSIRPPIDAGLVDIIYVSEQAMAQRFGFAWEDRLGLTAVQQRYPAEAEMLRGLVQWTERTHWQPDDVRRAAGDAMVDSLRQARCYSNYALFAQFVKGDMAFARECFEAALNRAPRHPRTLANYAVMHADALGDGAGADALFRRALDSRPDHPHSLQLFVRFLEREGRSDEAGTYRARLSALSVSHSPEHPASLFGDQ
ncbi:hypothetical protein [Bradyrhizobium sp. SZCCHNS1054]|uniref:hypothetical protein n=1 Tax=Bradyrhizobium sp. SZCCHNS1054 TaxID=3057301 RepID=UPI0029167363|nr:hypothetical protein [Bradyrhizobium sp. SZCCHNS1054]